MSASGCPGGSDCTCGCCAGVDASTPRPTRNRPGLDTVAHRSGTHADFLASMLAGLTDAGRPALASLSTRDPGDVSIGLLDAWAVAADVLTFHTERHAQEAFLRTAVDRSSLVELGRLIGYRMRPGVAAETVLAFAVEPAPPTPPSTPGTAPEPGAAPPVVPAVVEVPVGLRVQSIPGPGEQPQTFEVLEDLEAHRGWGAIPASTTVEGVSATSAWFEGTTLGIRPGDVLVWDLGSSTQTKELAEVTTHEPSGRTFVRWNGSLALPAGVKALVFHKSLSVFGHSAPLWKSMSAEFKLLYAGASYTGSDWPDMEVNLETLACVHVEGSHSDIVDGSRVLLRLPDFTGGGVHGAVWTVASAVEGSQAEFAVSGRITTLLLSGSGSLGEQNRRNIVVHAVSEELSIARQDDTTSVTGDTVEVDRDVSALDEGRRLVLTGRTGAGTEVVHEAEAVSVSADGGRWKVKFDPPLPKDAVLDRPTVVLHANVALAGHGESTSELLGSGRADKAHQRFTLKGTPLTHVQSTGTTGASPALEVWVDDLRWELTDTLYDARPNDRVYVLRTDPSGADEVRFGDGAKGSRPPTGSQNVVGRYRTGIGAAGNVGAGSIANLLDRPLGLKGVSNPTPAAGGTDPEAASEARRTMPLPVRTLGRAVSLLDYADFARSFAGVSKASATVLTLLGGPTVVVTVAFGADGTDAIGDRLQDLTTSLVKYGDPHVALVVLDHTRKEFRLSMKVAVDPAHDNDTVLSGVRAAVSSRFAFAQRDFGQPVVRSVVVAVAQTVAGVVAVDLDLLYTGTAMILSDRLVAPAASVAAGAALPAGILVAAADPFDDLSVMT